MGHYKDKELNQMEDSEDAGSGRKTAGFPEKHTASGNWGYSCVFSVICVDNNENHDFHSFTFGQIYQLYF